MNNLSLEQLIADRRRRAEYFPAELFAEPAWDILLDLALATVRGRRLSVSAVCIGSGVPATTALRHIKILEGYGLIDRKPDADDARRVWLSLSEDARLAMCGYLGPAVVARAA